MQRFEKQMRAYLCEDIYWDVDQVNSHPSILISLLTNLNIHIPILLQEYVEQREKVLNQIAESYGTTNAIAKNLMLRLMYGGRVKSWIQEHALGLPSDEYLDQKLEWLVEDLEIINQKLQRFSLFQTAVQVFNNTYLAAERTRTSFLSLICTEYERQVLMYVKNWLAQQTPQRHLDVLIHDGGLMRRLPGEEEPPQQLLTGLNEELKKHFNTPYIKYTYKKFSNVISNILRAEIDQEQPYSIQA